MLLIVRICAAASILAVDTAAVATLPRVRREAAPGDVQLVLADSGNIVGAGYSDDTQQVTPQKCYNATVSSNSGQQAIMKLDGALSFSKLESELGISVSASGGYGMFAANAEADYMRSLQDTDYSLSLNYIHYVRGKVSVQIGGYGMEALSESGRTIYRDGKNPYFGLVCGDSYIESYEQGALLTMGLNIKFSSSEAKTAFNAKFGASYGSIASMAASVKSVANELQITGSVTVQALQKGGEPSQLSNLLSKDDSGNYHALGCSITAMDDCIKAASGLLEYAKSGFPNQVSSENNKGFTPLGVRFMSSRPIEHIGLIRTASLVTQEVLKARNELSCKLKEAQYYQQKLHPFFSITDTIKPTDTIMSNATSVLSKANSNVNILMNPTEGAVGCFNFPDRCKSIKTRIDSLLRDITVSDLAFLESIKYQIVVDYTMARQVFYSGNTIVAPNTWWNTVRGYYSASDVPKILFYARYGVLRGTLRLEGEGYVVTSHITDTSCSFNLRWVRSPTIIEMMTISGDSSDGGNTYAGKHRSPQSEVRPAPLDWDVLIKKELSPFFFEAFTATPQGVGCKMK